MRILPSFALFLCFALNVADGFAQAGDFLVTHNSPRIKNVDNFNFEMIHDRNGLLCVANRNGVLKFDGHLWDFIPTPSAVFALAVDEQNNLYLGCRDGFGMIVNDGSGKETYKSLSDSLDNSTDIIQVEEFNGSIYFLNEQSLFKFSPDDGKIVQQWTSGESGIFNRIFWAEERILLDDEVRGILEIKNGSLEKAARNTPDGGLVEFWVKHPTKEEYIFGTSEENLFRVKDNEITELEFADFSLDGFPIVDGLWLSEDLLVVATLNGGCLFIDPNTKKLIQSVNYHTGLPDNEVLAITQDLDQGLWIAHEFGFSRVAPELPMKSFAHYPGLEGNLLAATRFNQKIYVATSLGVFYLDEVRSYRDIVFYVEKGPVSARRQAVEKPVEASLEEPTPEEESVVPELNEEKPKKRRKKRKGLFGSSRKNKKNKTLEQPDSVEASTKEIATEPETQKKSGFLGGIFRGKKNTATAEGSIEKGEEPIPLERRIRRQLQSIRFVYKPVIGIEAKCKQLIEFHDKLLVSSNEGIFEVQDSAATLISSSPIRYLYPSENWELVMASTMDDQFLTYEFEDDVWREINFFPYFRAFVQHINEDKKQNIWLAGSDEVYKIEVSDDSVTMSQYPLTNQFYDEVYILNRKERTYFINSSGYSYYDEQKDEILLDTILQKQVGLPSEYVYDEPDNLWVHDGRIWRWLKDTLAEQVQMDYLNLFGNIHKLSFDPESNDLWVISSDQEFYNFNLNNAGDYSTNHSIFLKAIRDKGGNLLPFSNLSIQQENSHIVFEFSQPDYLGLLELQYQYQLKGLNQEWSGWSPNNVISFHFLPPGTYSLQVKTKNAFGQTQEMKPYRFKVIPPVWKRWWFYLAEIIFFGSLVLLSFRMNRMKFKNRLITRGLTFMTLILILEFLETVVESSLNLKSSPIIDFFIEASIAFMILPIERSLRGYLLRPDDSSTSDPAKV